MGSLLRMRTKRVPGVRFLNYSALRRASEDQPHRNCVTADPGELATASKSLLPGGTEPPHWSLADIGKKAHREK